MGVAGPIFEAIDLPIDVGTVDDRAWRHVDARGCEELPDEGGHEDQAKNVAPSADEHLDVILDLGLGQEDPRDAKHEGERSERA